MEPRTRDFRYQGYRLVYDEYGSGDKPVLLLPGLLFSRRMHGPLASSIAERGYRVVCLDLLGHGDSDRPPEMWNYSMTIFGAQAIALLDHLEIGEAIVGGTSLGANTTLEATMLAPERVRGMLVEMPVLDNALLGCAIAFAPLLVWLTLGAPAARASAGLLSRVPRGAWLMSDLLLDWGSQDPKPSASLLQGLFFGRSAPPREERRKIENKALVIGHPRDPIHPFSDSDMLVRELPNGRLLEANSFFEMRLTPERLTTEITDFVDDCWAEPKPARKPRARSGRTAASARSTPSARRRSG